MEVKGSRIEIAAQGVLSWTVRIRISGVSSSLSVSVLILLPFLRVQNRAASAGLPHTIKKGAALALLRWGGVNVEWACLMAEISSALPRFLLPGISDGPNHDGILILSVLFA